MRGIVKGMRIILPILILLFFSRSLYAQEESKDASIVVAETQDTISLDVKGMDLINVLKKNYTVIIVTHNMQQAARVSDYTGFFYLGELIEFGKTKQIFENPNKDLTEKYMTGRFG